ncbi:MAG TPA: hypothetical protein VM581_00685 [Magnetospirillaceae bacterium]|nr:hypothetical protein [Magnetospirillaceae bacterium]
MITNPVLALVVFVASVLVIALVARPIERASKTIVTVPSATLTSVGLVAVTLSTHLSLRGVEHIFRGVYLVLLMAALVLYILLSSKFKRDGIYVTAFAGVVCALAFVVEAVTA